MIIPPPKLSMIDTNKNDASSKEEFVRRDPSKLALGIFEDDARAVIERYGCLSGKYEIYICLDDSSRGFMNYSRLWGGDLEGDQRVSEKRLELKDELAKLGIVVEKVCFNETEMPFSLDLYFTDGLGGKCCTIADRFGKDKTYILTGDPLLQQLAKKEEYKLVENGLEEIIKRHSLGVVE